MKKHKLILSIILTVVLVFVSFNGLGTPKADAATTYTVRFYSPYTTTLYATRTANPATILSNPPANPTLSGREFNGWAYKNNTNVKFNIKTTPITANVDLVATWLPH